MEIPRLASSNSPHKRRETSSYFGLEASPDGRSHVVDRDNNISMDSGSQWDQHLPFLHTVFSWRGTGGKPGLSSLPPHQSSRLLQAKQGGAFNSLLGQNKNIPQGDPTEHWMISRKVSYFLPTSDPDVCTAVPPLPDSDPDVCGDPIPANLRS